MSNKDKNELYNPPDELIMAFARRVYSDVIDYWKSEEGQELCKELEDK